MEHQSPRERQHTDALFSEPWVTLWTTRGSRIPVCWMTPGFDTEKLSIRNSLARTWEREAHLFFTGFEACPTTGDVQFIRVELTVATDPEGSGGGSAYVGVGALRRPNEGRSVHIAVPKTSYPYRVGRLDYLAVHEFGHTLGFHHEQDRSDDENECPGGSVIDGVTYTQYDADSVMNYCNSRGNLSGELSTFDKVGIASVYGPRRWSTEFGYPTWDAVTHPRVMADVDADGVAELVAFGPSGVLVSEPNVSTRTMGAPELRLADFGTMTGGWSGDRHPRTLADVNKDGRADIIGFGEWGVYVSYSTGTGFTPTAFSLGDFGPNAGGWGDQMTFPRVLADVNGDGAADIVGFGQWGVHVSRSQCTTGSGCAASNQFAPSQFILAAFGRDPSAGGWVGERHPRMAADVNNDGKADLIGFADAGVFVALSTSSGTTVSFASPTLWLADLGAVRGGWSVLNHPRRMGDFNGDGQTDIIGFGEEFTFVSYSTGTSFLAPTRIVRNFTVQGGQWASHHLRIVGDMDRDRRVDLVGFSDAGTHVFTAAMFANGAL